jgi:intracellular septation protein
MTRSIPSGAKALLDYIPLIAFFAAFRLYDLNAALVVLIVTVIAASCITFIWERKISVLPLVMLLTVLVFSGSALFFDDERLIKIKPTVIQLLFALSLVVSVMLRRPLIKYILKSSVDLKERDSAVMCLRFAAFFVFCALLNEVVWRTQSTDVWVNFKVFGLTGLSLFFFISQIPFLMKRGKMISDKAKK